MRDALVALFDPDHVHHDAAHDWFAEEGRAAAPGLSASGGTTRAPCVCAIIPLGHAMPKAASSSEMTASEALERALDRRSKALAVCAADPEAAFENVWHTLILLDLPPLERLNRSLQRGRAVPLQR